jgi:hypothetical protein
MVDQVLMCEVCLLRIYELRPSVNQNDFMNDKKVREKQRHSRRPSGGPLEKGGGRECNNTAHQPILSLLILLLYV